MGYRSYAVIFLLFTIADILDSLEFEGLFPNDEFPSIPVSIINIAGVVKHIKLTTQLARPKSVGRCERSRRRR